MEQNVNMTFTCTPSMLTVTTPISENIYTYVPLSNRYDQNRFVISRYNWYLGTHNSVLSF